MLIVTTSFLFKYESQSVLYARPPMSVWNVGRLRVTVAKNHARLFDTEIQEKKCTLEVARAMSYYFGSTI